ncbi:hypothetical protein L6164_016638 [Bauhinia variegata]|uniref:Uncharacterized protein n=1 Tax=Bauhinia variegata TaxID=167791 RepID=A0ACB9NTT9_BAUVA|nr:hypothetical protein L6164_016638 [Bauhinia variegata]
MQLQEEEKIEQSKSLPISANVAHRNSQMTKPQQPQFSNFRSGFKQGRQSYNSGGNYHYNSHSGNTNQAAINGSRSHSNRPKVTCNKNGYTALECYNKFNHAYSFKKASKVLAMIASPNTVADTSWYIDSGASHHPTSDINNISIHSEYTRDDQVVVGNDMTLPITHTSTSSIDYSLSLKNVLHVPHITKNLLSISKLTKDNNVFLEFHPNHCLVKNL